MKIPSKTSLIVLGVIFALILGISDAAIAAPKSGERGVSNLVRRITRLQSKLQRKVKKLSPAQVRIVSARQSSLSADSDRDGLIDLLEQALETLVCDADTDDDGLEDGDEIEDENDPIDDSDCEEVAGYLTLLSEDEIGVGDFIVFIDEDTEFKRDGSEEEVSVEDFNLGQCIEIEATLEEDGEFYAHEVELSEDDEACEEEEEEDLCESDEEDEEDEGEDDDEDTDDDEEDNHEDEEQEDDDEDTDD